MVDAKRLLSPKVIFPLVGICVLLVVAALVAVFYVRNPTVTDSIFNPADATTASTEDTTPSPYTGNNDSIGSYAVEMKSTVPPHEIHSIESSTLLHTLTTTTPMSSSGTAEPHAIEPVNHD